MREYKVFKIVNGTVIDHIQSPLGLKVFNLLKADNEGIVSIGMNFDSAKTGKKDLIKFENKVLDKTETDKIALLCPTATINIINNGKVVEKRPMDIPNIIKNQLKCPNPRCITNNEDIDTIFQLEQTDPVIVKCEYCERTTVVKPENIK